MNKGILFLLLIGLASCNQQPPPSKVVSTPQERCIDGVIYYASWRSLSAAYNQDSTLKLCDENWIDVKDSDAL